MGTMKRVILPVVALLITGCATVPGSYVKRAERLEREVARLHEEVAKLREEARELKASLKKTEEYENRIRRILNAEYRRRGSFRRLPKAK